MSGYQQPTSAASSRGRIVLAALASLLLLGSLGFFILAGRPRARARDIVGGSGAAAAQFKRMATTVEASIARQARQAAVQASETAHHQVDDPADPPTAQRPAIAGVERVVRRWLLGYLPYEVDELTTGERGDLEATSTAPLARSLLSSPPVIPSTGQRPQQGHPLDVIATLASAGHEAHAYTEIAYGAEQIGFHLTLRRGGQFGWLVADFHA